MSYKTYIDDVQQNKIKTCNYVKLAVKRFINDLDRVGDTDFPYFFDESRGEKIIKFFRMLRHVTGELAGHEFQLQDFQQFKLINIFGWVDADGNRRYRTAYNEIARKNGKSTELAGIGLYLFTADRENSPEIYTAATTREQANIIHNVSKQMVEKSPELSKRINILKYGRRVHYLELNGKSGVYMPLSSDADTLDGLNCHGALIDEYHAHKTSELYNVINSSTGSRRQPLIYIITTAGFNLDSPCYDEREYAIEALNQGFDERYFSLIYTLDRDDNWMDETVWEKSNPNMGVSVYLDDLLSSFNRALKMPTSRIEFKTKRLNVWCNQGMVWIPSEKLENCRNPFDESSLNNLICFGGLDLSWKNDFTAYVLCFPPQNGFDKYRFLFRFFLPENEIVEKSRQDKFDYITMADQGYIKLTPGEKIDIEYIYKQICDDMEKYNLKEIAYDQRRFAELEKKFLDNGMRQEMEEVFVEYKQYARLMSPAAKMWEKKIYTGEIATNGNPVIEWMNRNADITTNVNGEIMIVKMNKNKTTRRIDGIISSVMALDRAVRWSDSNESVYEIEDIEIFDF